jgi:hypothetical protein
MREWYPNTFRLPAACRPPSKSAMGLLGRFFLWADSAARNRGVTLHVTTFDELVAVDKAGRAR